MPQLQPGQAVGYYRIVRTLGQGGQATAYLSEDTRLGRPVVLKVMRSELVDDAARRRFETEAALCSALDHPNVAAVYDLGEAEGAPYLVMQYTEGKTLKELLRGRPLGIPSALSLAIQIADGVAVAHAAGIAHRDLKPTNVIVTASGQAKILDFGLAKLLTRPDEARSESEDGGSVWDDPCGTAGYASPEQVLGEPVDHRTDIFSLGALLYEMLTGRQAFDGRNPLEVFHAVVNHVPAPLSQRLLRCPPELDAIVERCLAKRPRERYQTMAALRDDLKAAMRRISHETGFVPTEASATLLPPERARRQWPTAAGLGFLRRWRRPASAAATVPTETGAAGVEEPRPGWGPDLRKSLAVTPFRNLTGETSLDDLGLAFADGLITSLSSVGQLAVRPSVSIARFARQEIDPQRVAAELDVGWLLTGAFVKNAEQLRVSTQLVAPATGELLWGDRVELPAQDPLAAQDALADLVTAGLLQLLPAAQERAEAPATRKAEAHELYLRGREMLGHFVLRSFDLGDLELAIRLLNESAGLDPAVAGAHASLARCYLLHAQGYGGPEYFRLAERAVRRALELEPALLKARLQALQVQLQDGDKDRARTGLVELQREAPDYPGVLELEAHLCRLDGRHDEALAAYDRLLARSPDDATVVAWKRSRVLLQAGRVDQASDALERARFDAPQHAMIEALTGLVLLHQERVDEGCRLLGDLLRRHPSFDGARPLAALGLAMRGETEPAAALLTDDVQEAARADPDVALWLGIACARTGRPTQAIEWLRQAERLGYQDRAFLRGNPLLAPLREARELKALLG